MAKTFIENLDGAFKALARLFTQVNNSVNDLELSWALVQLDHKGIDKDIYMLETSRAGFRLRRISAEGSMLAQVGILTSGEAWTSRLTLEYK